MSETDLICGNWGGTHLRAFRLDEQGEQIGEIRSGQGVNSLSPEAQQAHWFDLIEDWIQKNPNVPHLICGSAGSNLGWLQTGYVEAPAGPEEIARAIEWRRIGGTRLGIVPGLSCQNVLGEPDRMRSEETELLGYLACFPKPESKMVCLPGTHNKWVKIQDERIGSFLTSLGGELFHAVDQETVVTRGSDPLRLGRAFDEGVSLGVSKPEAEFVHKLFSVRARQLVGTLETKDSTSFLSGLIIGSDIAGAGRLFAELAEGVTIIAGDALGSAYERALKLAGIESRRFGSEDMVRAGFAMLAKISGEIDHAG